MGGSFCASRFSDFLKEVYTVMKMYFLEVGRIEGSKFQALLKPLQGTLWSAFV